MNKNIDKEFERKLWASADALRGNISSENYMHIVIGILFLKHMSDKYDFAVEKLKKEFGEDDYKNYKDDKDLIDGVSFIIPEKSSWKYIKSFASQSNIGSIIDNAFTEIEELNPELRGLFDKNYNREELDQNKLGQVVSEFSNIDLNEFGEDVIGRVYEYFLGEFFLKQGQKGGEFYTPKSVVDLICRIVDPHEGKIYDPTAGTGGMFVQARKSLIKQGKENPNSIVAYGQEYQNKTWKLSKVNLLLHGFPIENIKLGAKSADTFTEDQHKGERFDYVMANPPFNVKVWGQEKLLDDPRWEWGIPPKGNANYAFLSHMIHKLNDNGRGATVLANGSLSASGKNDIEIRKGMVEGTEKDQKGNKIDAIISLPDKLFYTTGIPVCIWVFNKNKNNNNILMIEAKNLKGNMLSKKNRELTEENINKIVNHYKNHLSGKEVEEIGFAKTITKNELKENDWSFVPGRYVGILEEKIDVKKTKEDISKLGEELNKLFDEFNELMPKVKESIKKVLNENFEKNK